MPGAPPSSRLPGPAGWLFPIPAGPVVAFAAMSPATPSKPSTMPPTVVVRRPIPGHATVAMLAAVMAVVVVGGARGEDPVAVLITGPLAAKVGDRVSFEVELVNRSGRPLEKLRVVDYFDKGYHHEASASPIEQKGTVDLAAGTSRRLTLDFLLDEPGRQCHRVEILDQSHSLVGGATSCVQVSGVALPAAAPAAAMSAPVEPPAAAYPATTYPGTTYPPTPAASIAPPTATLPATPPTPLAAPAASLVPPPPAAVAVPPPSTPFAAVPLPTTPPPTPPAVPATIAPAGPALATSGIPASTAPPVAPSLELDLVGPAEATTGMVSEFVATVRNTGPVASGATTLEFSWEDAFTPLEASEGYKLASSKVVWDLPSIEPGGQLRRQINLRAQPMAGYREPAAGRSCVRAVLGGTVGGMMVADESCVLIRSTAPRPRTARESGVRVTLADCDDPVTVGQPTTLICTVVNGGAVATGKLDLTVVLPERATLVGEPSPSRVRIDGANVAFDAIPSVPPGGQATFELAYRLSGSGAGKATAILTGAELDGSLESACQTTFLTP